MTTPRIADIQRAVAEHFGIPLERMLSQRRVRGLARPRQIAMFLAWELTDRSLGQIGRSFDRDHTTIMSGRDRIAELVRTDGAIAKAIDDITRQLTDDPRQIKLPIVA